MTVTISHMSTLRSSAVGDWEACGDAFYSRELLYDMMWEDTDLDSKRVCCSPFGGPIAVVRDERQMVVITSGGSVRPIIRTFAASGRLLGSHVWDKGRIIGWGWSASLDLVVVDEQGRVVVLSMHSEKLREFGMGSAAESLGICQAVVFGDGVVVLTGLGPVGRQVWAATSLSSPRPMPLAALPKVAATAGVLEDACIAVLEPHLTASSGLEVLLGTSEGIWMLDDLTCRLQTIPAGSLSHSQGASNAATEAAAVVAASEAVLHLAVSPDGAFIAAYTRDARIHVFSSDLTKHLSEFDTKAEGRPLRLQWCGSDGVAVQWPELLLLVGPFGDHASWPLTGEAVWMVPEVDGLRLVSGTRHEILRRLPQSLSDIFKPGSTSPSAMLWEGRDLYEQRSARADRVLRGMSAEELQSAVAACIEAAGLDLNPSRQKALLRAACFGAAFCPRSGVKQDLSDSLSESQTPSDVSTTSLYTCCSKLRILNALREPRPGMPLTLPQLDVLSLAVVVARLVSYREWLLAFRIAGTLPHHAASRNTLAVMTAPPGAAAPSVPCSQGSAMLPSGTSPREQVLLQWACAKISATSSASLSDMELKDQVSAKLKACPGIHFAPLAAHAQAIGRRRLALKLLDEETSCSLQVPLLLSLRSGLTAPLSSGGLSSAIRSPSGTGAGSGDLASEESDEDGDVQLKALRKAIESGDTDLVYLVLFSIYKSRSLQDFWAIVSSRTLAKNLFLKFCRSREPELLETILTVNNQTVDLAEQQLRRTLSQYTAAYLSRSASESALTKLVSGLSDVAAKYGVSKEHAFQSKAVSEFSLLRREQAKLERETGQHMFVGLSLIDTVRACIRLGHHRQAASLKKQFSISDKRFYWLKILTLCEEKSWEELDMFASERKSPIGWEPFLQLAKKHAAPRDVQSRIIAKMPDNITKAEMFTAIGCTREAAEVAAKIRDSDLFAKIQGLVPATSPAGLAIAQIREKFQASFR
ncbi:hypothetical protein CEUSTIGMA_g8819.t1 [Chlamydomonas eustigma]|uniref:Vacuolar protein sorting-associated protein 16 homolog n=1 Tax=Chlamydomonas eustigma TaxID=1157962 RepID=A0A250XE77_9CHLO|nr:hypothetical protein CEUSTIGMA_g8819.t1 [Chlamydomonas eustigma]|eukprot:GAX81388.1 hypothetical protein CEUSTIGMA_g8819.t1 [Chlamydomonas eustigma]